MAEDEKTPLKNLIFQILIACVIPIIGGWIVVGILYVKFSQDGAVTVIEPSYAPSKSLILPIWTLLYVLMGFASWRVYHRGEGFLGKARHTLLIYIAKLFLNWMWPLIAYGLESLLGATITIGILLIFVTFTGFLFFRIDRLAGILFIPYIAYSSFATVLSVHIYFLNQ